MATKVPKPIPGPTHGKVANALPTAVSRHRVRAGGGAPAYTYSVVGSDNGCVGIGAYSGTDTGGYM